MPEYEYYCRRCAKPFEALVSMREHEKHVEPCPLCKREDQVERRLGEPNVITSRKS